MDALNKNFPVAQPDDNGNYEWMQVRAGCGMDTTGTIDIRDGDLDMGGGTIYDWNEFIPPPGGGGGLPAPYWLSQPACAVGLLNNRTLTINFPNPPPAFLPEYVLSTPVRDGGLQPYAEYDGSQYIRIFEPGTYECTVSLSGKFLLPNVVVLYFRMINIDAGEAIVRSEINSLSQPNSGSSPDPFRLPVRQLVSYFTFSPADFSTLPFINIEGQFNISYIGLTAEIELQGGGQVFMSVRKISDNFLGAQAIPP